MNRETKRMMQRQEKAGADGSTSSRRDTAVAASRRRRSRVSISGFFGEVRHEMRQVAWPTRPELLNYTTIVLGVLIFMSLFIFGLGYACSKFVQFLFNK
ncbi:MAG: preprotein translocase subunit SecE [Actinomycetota bacterium]|jgi:preprotein translocase subunit SecE